MHYIAQLYNSQLEILKKQVEPIKLRGYDYTTKVKDELVNVKLAVNAIAYNPCITNRDLYLEKIKGLNNPMNWERYAGKVIDSTYKIVHKKCEEYIMNEEQNTNNLSKFLSRNQNQIINNVLLTHAGDLKRIVPKPSNTQINDLKVIFKKIVNSEADIASSIINFELSKTRDANIKGIFDEYLNFNTNLVLKGPGLGFGEKSTPDFIYKHEVIGDIKTGVWQDFFSLTAVAYALAYEEHTNRDMNFGVILHVEFPQTKRIPIYTRSKIEFLDNRLRDRFLAIRDRKLQILYYKNDPGKPPEKTMCNKNCYYFSSQCWTKQ